MKALVFTRADVAEVAELDEPTIGADEVLVAARQVGICHSDFDLLDDRYIIPVQFPIIPGHEWSGEVVAVGPEVRNVRPGDRIVGECTVNGGADHFGFSISGAAAERFKIRADWAHRLPDELSWQQGATVEPFSCAFHAIRRLGGIQPGDDVAVLGGGAIGLSAVAASSALGGRTMLIEPLEHRRRLGVQLGADEVGRSHRRRLRRRPGAPAHRRPGRRRRHRGVGKSQRNGIGAGHRRLPGTARVHRHQRRRDRSGGAGDDPVQGADR